MGKKDKIGKARKDKFYQLAKESGYRSRAAFKLLQMNRKFEFLQSARILLDLCAAPGSWLQVAKQTMPPKHKIIGIDLVPIAPIPTVETLQCDIRTAECRQLLRHSLLHAKCDVILHDGAPNVGSSWSIDEYQQAQLCLHSFQLATEFLVKGGTFVSKVFRSKDYEPLKWVLDQFFSSVKVFKPEASRLESAEIYLVCQRYKAPEVIDQKFFDPKHVFKELIESQQQAKKCSNNTLINLIHPEKRKRQRDGYDDNDNLYHELAASEFLQSDDYLSQLARINKILIDKPEIAASPFTTPEIRCCLEDIKVLGKVEIKKLIRWRKQLAGQMKANQQQLSSSTNPDQQQVPLPAETTVEDDAEAELIRLKEEERKQLKKKLKKEREVQRRQQIRVNLNMVHPGDRLDYSEDTELFSQQGLAAARQSLGEGQGDRLLGAEVSLEVVGPLWDRLQRDEAKEQARLAGRRYEDLASGQLSESQPPARHYDRTSGVADERARVWEDQPVPPVDPEIDDLQPVEGCAMTLDEVSKTNNSEEDSEDDENQCKASPVDLDRSQSEQHEAPAKKFRPLTALERALALKLVQSTRHRRVLEEATYNRYNFTYDTVDGEPPAFLLEDERRHMRPLPPLISAADVEQQRDVAVNVRTSKKAEQAKARKRRRLMKRMRGLKSRIENLPDEITDKERIMKIREIYKASGVNAKRKRPVTVVTGKSGFSTKTARNASKQSSKVKVKRVDPRMKADKRTHKMNSAKKSKLNRSGKRSK